MQRVRLRKDLEIYKIYGNMEFEYGMGRFRGKYFYAKAVNIFVGYRDGAPINETRYQLYSFNNKDSPLKFRPWRDVVRVSREMLIFDDMKFVNLYTMKEV